MSPRNATCGPVQRLVRRGLCGSENPTFLFETRLSLLLVQSCGQIEERAERLGVIAFGRPFTHGANLGAIPNQIGAGVHQLLNSLFHHPGPDFSVQNEWPLAWSRGWCETSLERPDPAYPYQVAAAP